MLSNCFIPFLLASAVPSVLADGYSNIDRSATAGAQSLLRLIQSRFGSQYLSGQQDLASLQWVQGNIGKTPAILGSDFMDYTPSSVAHGSRSNATEDAINFHHQGGINALVWHWRAPACLYDTSEHPWYTGFYTEATCFDAKKALAEASHNGTNYSLLLHDIDAIAAQIKRLSAANVPILFRPLHEPEGAWFWWGAQGADTFLELWDLVYTRITVHHNLHNIVWVCNTADPEWYPGNDKCDIATIDHYADAGDHGVLEKKWHALYEVTGGQRVLALAEVGVIPDPEQQAKTNTHWAYWMTWSDEFIKDGKYNTKEFLRKVYESPYVVTLEDAQKHGNGTLPRRRRF
ncbi:glycoside hydrolase [Aspergillus affinis]|uniref:glycoside hydrolase n=1 Tax=Aspergillus affinis TaxID=1070780 RepID=UPI0022FDCCDB|nr:glycoside hydrolase [Aspergillus affinis]KAI9036606.1 glycoside hydrolase [Aspergillus affinis]